MPLNQTQGLRTWLASGRKLRGSRTEQELDRMGVDDAPSLRFEVNSPAEVYELFGALGKSRRFATDARGLGQPCRVQ